MLETFVRVSGFTPNRRLNSWCGLCLLLASVFVATPSGWLSSQTTAEMILNDVRVLADDSLQGRGVGTAGLEVAAEYLADRFEEIGLLPGIGDSYFQDFVVDSTAPALAHSGIGTATIRNVVGILPGHGHLSSQVVVVGAHYDHLGLGGSGSLDPDSVGVVHNGADDNASGTAAVLATARSLAGRSVSDRRTFVFVAFSGEESGLLGSAYYVKNPILPNDSTVAMINFDMVGRIKENTLIAIGTGSASELPALLDATNEAFGFTLAKQEDPWGRSDHSSFYGESIPVIHLFTDNHADYHRTTDDWEKIDADGIAKISEYAASLAWNLASREDRLTFVDVPRPAPTAGMGSGAWLGSIPDMSGSPGGVRFNGVRSGSPADSAGLLAGDILVQLGDFEIADLYDMTAALRAHAPGDTVAVSVIRDGERIETTVTLGRRGG
ncbi:MAG: M28 family peptidase [Myxococcota bacterium]|nr:M28 family peptidase [Myxococcota bacterium]